MINPDWADGLNEQEKQKIFKSELERVLRTMAQEIGDLKRRVAALEAKAK